jgi:hypothetical protein
VDATSRASHYLGIRLSFCYRTPAPSTCPNSPGFLVIVPNLVKRDSILSIVGRAVPVFSSSFCQMLWSLVESVHLRTFGLSHASGCKCASTHSI